MELQKIFVSLALKIDDYKEGLRQAADHAEDMRGKVGKTFDNLLGKAKLAMAGVGLAIAAGFGMAVKSSIEVNAQLETTQLQFETLMGSADLAREHVAGLFEFAEKTPFETGPIIDASLKLQTFGGAALNTMGNIQLLGDAAAATNAPIDELGFWVGRLYANLQAGQPFGEAAMRLQELAVMGPDAVNEMNKLRDSGKSAAEVFAYFQKDLGRFEGAMDKQAATWKGMASTIKDQVQLLIADALEPFFEKGKEGMAGFIEALSDPELSVAIDAISQDLEGLMETTIEVFGVIGKEIKTFATQRGIQQDLERLGFTEYQEAQVEFSRLYEEARKKMGLGFFESLMPDNAAAVTAAVRDELYSLNGELIEFIRLTEGSRSEWDDWGREVTERPIRELVEHYRELAVEIEAAYTVQEEQDIANQAYTNLQAARVAALTDKYREETAERMDIVRAAADEQAAIAQAEAEAFNAIFQSVLGDYTKDLPGADKPLVSPERWMNVVSGGLGPEQQALLDEYRGRVEKLTTEIFNLENGVGTYGLEQEKVNEKLADARGELAHYQNLMAPLASVTGDVSTVHQGLKVNVDAARQAIFDQLSQMPGAEAATVAYGIAIGVMTQEQGRAAIAAALVKEKVEDTAKAIAAGVPVEEALADFDSFIDKIENGLIPTTLDAATEVPQNLEDMRAGLSDEALASGRALGEGYQQGIDETRQDVIDASVQTAEDLIADTKGAFGIQSPSTVFQGIGQNLMDGLMAGIEAGKTALRDMLSGVADLIPEWLKKFLGIASPAQELVPIGEAIVEGIMEGIGNMEGDLVDRLGAVIQNATTAGNLAANFGSVFARQMMDPLEEDIRELNAGIKSARAQRTGLEKSMAAVAARYGWDINDPGFQTFLMSIRDNYAPNSAVRNDIEWMLNMHQARLSASTEEMHMQQRLAEAEEKRLAMEEQMLAIQEKQQQLNFLQMQFDLIKLINDNGLDPSILNGVQLGLGADPLQLMNIMGVVMDGLVTQASAELVAMSGTSPALTEAAPDPDDRYTMKIQNQNINGGQHIYITDKDRSELEQLQELLL